MLPQTIFVVCFQTIFRNYVSFQDEKAEPSVVADAGQLVAEARQLVQAQLGVAVQWGRDPVQAPLPGPLLELLQAPSEPGTRHPDPVRLSSWISNIISLFFNSVSLEIDLITVLKKNYYLLSYGN